MRLRQLFEEKVSEVAIIFGRFNPPHKGHKVAWETAATKDVWYVGTNQSTVGPKDPLPYEIKVECMKVVWPDVADHIVPETSWLTLASYVYQKHGAINLIIVTDEEWVVPTVKEYNGKSGPHGEYNFPEIRLFHNSIEEAKADLRKSSATSLRDAVSKGDRQGFTDAAGVSAETPIMGKPFFDLVAEYLLPYQEKAKAKADKAKKKPETKKKEEPKKEKESKKDKDDMKMKDLAESGYQHGFADPNAPSLGSREKRDFKRREMDHELGHEDDPDFERKLRQQQMDKDRGPWYLRIDGKILKSKGEVKVFDWKKGANNYALAIIKNKPEMQGKIMLTKNPEDKDNG
jgi:hypothetical protein